MKTSQRGRQLQLYKRDLRPCYESKDYQDGYDQARHDIKRGVTKATRPTHLHVDSGQFLRWLYGYQDAVLCLYHKKQPSAVHIFHKD